MLHGLLHDVKWSFNQGVLHWVLPDGVALATWGLVFAGFIQLRAIAQNNRAIKNQGDAQSQQWEQDAKLRNEREKPKYRFGLIRIPVELQLQGMNYHKSGLALWVANFGSSSLYVQEVFIKHRERSEYGIPVNRIVPAGGELHFTLPDAGWQNAPGVDLPPFSHPFITGVFSFRLMVDVFEGRGAMAPLPSRSVRNSLGVR